MILLLLLIILTGVAYAYFATDVFKSNKELFFKYMTQMGTSEEGLLDQQLKEYLEKQKNTPYLNEGNVTVNITSSENQKQYENTNRITLTFDGQVDRANDQTIQNISLNYSDEVKFPLSYKQIKDVMGIQTSYIGNKYVAINQSGLQNLGTDFTLEEETTNPSNSLGKIQEMLEVSFSQEDWQRVKDMYFNVLDQQLQDSYFSKIEEADSRGYQLRLKGENIKNLLVKLLETLKNDQKTLDKMNEYIKIQKNSLKITASSIEDLIKSVNNNTQLYQENLEITVYESKGKTRNLSVKLEEAELKLERILTQNEQQYRIELQSNDNNQPAKITFDAKFLGLPTMQNITENYELILEMQDIKYQYGYHNNVKFTDQTNIEEFNNNNSMMLQEASQEERITFINAVIERLQNVNQMQMQQLGIEENDNPLQYIIPQFGMYTSALNVTTDADTTMSEAAINAYNAKFENYESTNLRGTTIKGLLTTIQLNNEANEQEDRKITEIHFDGQEYEVTDQNIVLLKSSVELETAYRVELERDEETGIIYRVVINKK